MVRGPAHGNPPPEASGEAVAHPPTARQPLEPTAGLCRAISLAPRIPPGREKLCAEQHDRLCALMREAHLKESGGELPRARELNFAPPHVNGSAQIPRLQRQRHPCHVIAPPEVPLVQPPPACPSAPKPRCTPPRMLYGCLLPRLTWRGWSGGALTPRRVLIPPARVLEMALAGSLVPANHGAHARCSRG